MAQPGPGYSVADVHAGWVEALKAAGQTVFEFNLDDRLAFYGSVLLPVSEGKFKRALTTDQSVQLAINGLYAAIMKCRPHVLLVVSAFFTPPELLQISRDAGVKVVILHTECPYENERQLALAPYADFNFVNDPTGIEAFQAVAPTEYLPHAYRPSVHCPGDPLPELACDLTFVGTGFPSRIEFFEQMDLDGIDLVLAGNWALLDQHPLASRVPHDLDDCLDNDRAVDLYRSAKVGINLYRREHNEHDSAEGWAMGPREVEMAASGLFFLRDPRPEGDEVFDMLPTFSGPEEASELLRWWLRHDGYRETAAQKAREAISDRTFDRHAARLLRLLEKEL